MSLTMPLPPSTHAGTKRRAPSPPPDDTARFTKRFHLLNLSDLPRQPQQQQQQQQLYIPLPSPHQHAHPSSPSYSSPASPPPRRAVPASIDPLRFSSDPESVGIGRREEEEEEGMSVDDTPTRIYVSDLSAELAADEPAEVETGLSMLPEIERELGRVPDWILGIRRREEEEKGKELVLYASGKDKDEGVVGRVVEEMKARRRGQWADNLRGTGGGLVEGERGTETAHGFGGLEWGVGRNGTEPKGMAEETEEEDVDAMEIE